MGKTDLDKTIGRIALLKERLSPVSEVTGIYEMTPLAIRCHLREIADILGELAMELKERK